MRKLKLNTELSYQFYRDKSNTPSGFTLKLRKHVRTRRLEDVRQLGYDRVCVTLCVIYWLGLMFSFILGFDNSLD